jgi:hypothetical protein
MLLVVLNLATIFAIPAPRISSHYARLLLSIISQVISARRLSPGHGLISCADFSIFAPPKLQPISEAEGEVVAWSTKQGHGSRPIIPGTLTGVQLLRSKDYIQIVAFLKQENVDIPANDTGGELDGAGQDDVCGYVISFVRVPCLMFFCAFSGATPLVAWYIQMPSVVMGLMNKPLNGTCTLQRGAGWLSHRLTSFPQIRW